jgi:hypothetical protein
LANFNEQVLRIWEEWEELTGADANDPDDFVTWAMENKKLLPQIQSVKKMLRRQVTTALRQAVRVDDRGFAYRSKQCVLIEEEGAQHRLWFDTDRGGTPNLRRKAVHQRREGIANDVYRAVCDVERMNSVFPEDGQLNFLTEFAEDVAERRAADMLARDAEEAA